MTPLVVKLGGSTAGRIEMEQWIAVLASATLPLVIVPGGGPFADQVRSSQKEMHFSDAAAHEMAILAMEQFGIVIAERHPRLQPARSLDDLETILAEGGVPVWLPSQMTRNADIAPSWDITSDSLAAWLCGQIGSRHLLLCKQVDPEDFSEGLQALVDKGVVDAMLPELLGEETSLYISGPSSLRSQLAELPMSRIPGSRMRMRAAAGGGERR
ncbi:amino acid kinase family protein [Neorhizobium sp. DT-125]|uniref:amino acid kinase family protein n=1 Tax=Neorhizobium sp. DT-125 TaxID=3396163 RepID=UPI003F1BD85F